MIFCCHLRSDQWEKIYAYLKDYKGLHLKDEQSVRRFVEGVLCVLTTGIQWRRLPREYGNWHHLYQRFCHWCDKGIWYKMLYYFQHDADMAYIMIDSTIKDCQEEEGLGRSCGGFSSKIHAVCTWFYCYAWSES